jgi:hypothetical protein
MKQRDVLPGQRYEYTIRRGRVYEASFEPATYGRREHAVNGGAAQVQSTAALADYEVVPVKMYRSKVRPGQTFVYVLHPDLVYIAGVDADKEEYYSQSEKRWIPSAGRAYPAYEIRLVPPPAAPVKIASSPPSAKADSSHQPSTPMPIPGPAPGGVTLADMKRGDLFQLVENGAVYELAEYPDSYATNNRQIKVAIPVKGWKLGTGGGGRGDITYVNKVTAVFPVNTLADLAQAPRFHLVWSPESKEPPQKQMTSRSQARLVARKMAEANPGQKFYLLAEAGAFEVQEVEEQVVTVKKTKVTKEV